MFFLFFALSMVDLERFRVFTEKISYRSELIQVGPAPEMSETGPSLLFEPVSCKQEQEFVWSAISSRVGRTHVISRLDGAPLPWLVCIRNRQINHLLTMSWINHDLEANNN